MSERDEFGAFLLGFIVGGLTGAVASLLLAPQGGNETRDYIKEKAIELGDKVNVSVEGAREKADEVTADARVRAEAILEDAKSRAEKIAAEAKSRAEEIQQRGQVVLEEQKARINKASHKDDAEGAASPSNN
jgi:gas vesicle protein